MKFSIITTVYNSNSTIRDTVKSVKEGFTDYEHIIVDAGSSDGTLDYLKTVSDIKLYVCEGYSISEAWNFALERVNGEYIGILNADDYYSNNIETELLKVINQLSNFEILAGPVSLINNDLTEIRLFNARVPNNWNLLMGIPFLHPGVFVKATLYRRNVIFNTQMKVAFDSDWLLKSFKLDSKIAIHNSIVYMRDGGNSIKFAWIGFGEYIQSLKNNGYGRIYILSYIFIKGILMTFKK